MAAAGTLGLFLLTAVAEMLGCYLVLLWAQRGAGPWSLAGAALSLAAFAWLLTRHPAESGRVYAAYGGVYTGSALAWLWLVDRVTPGWIELTGVGLIAAGCAVLILGSLR
jgi:small multidrug resistance family-3 protein